MEVGGVVTDLIMQVPGLWGGSGVFEFNLEICGTLGRKYRLEGLVGSGM